MHCQVALPNARIELVIDFVRPECLVEVGAEAYGRDHGLSHIIVVPSLMHRVHSTTNLIATPVAGSII